MKKYISLFIVLFAYLFASNSFAYTAPDKPPNGGFVLDQTGKLSQSEISQLNNKIENLKRTTKNEYGVAVLQSIDGEDIADVGQTIFRSWGIGNAQLNNGVLLVIALAERKTRIQTGKGVEGDLPDLKANDILQLTLKPLLKQGKFYEGIDVTLNKISISIDDRTKQVAELPPQAASHLTKSSNDFGTTIWVIIGATLIIGGGIFLLFYSNKKEEERAEKVRDSLRNRYKNNNLTTSPEIPARKRSNYVAPIAMGLGGAAAAVAISEVERNRLKREDEARGRRNAENTIQQDNRRLEESMRSSTYVSPSSSYDSSSSSSSYDSGGSFGGFGGGDSGGGGSSGDF